MADIISPEAKREILESAMVAVVKHPLAPHELPIAIQQIGELAALGVRPNEIVKVFKARLDKINELKEALEIRNLHGFPLPNED